MLPTAATQLPYGVGFSGYYGGGGGAAGIIEANRKRGVLVQAWSSSESSVVSSCVVKCSYVESS